MFFPVRAEISTLWYFPPQVNSLEPEPLDQMQECPVIAIDKFTAPFTNHAIRPGGGIRMHTPADAV